MSESAARQPAPPAWGKINPDCPSNFHRLEYHCADVAACFELLLEQPNIERRMAMAAGVSSLCSVTKSRLAVITFLHDLGKINTGFQFKVRKKSLSDSAPPKMGHIQESWLLCGREDFHAELGLEELVEWGEEELCELLCAAWSHHGRPFNPSEGVYRDPSIWKPFDGYQPLLAARSIGLCIREWFPKAFESGPKLPAEPAFVHLFAGFVALVDQIGSATEFFPFQSKEQPDYIETARNNAKEALLKRKLLREDLRTDSSSGEFRDIFGYEQQRPIQSKVSEVSLNSRLLILESETGSGKTEAAIIRFVQLWKAGVVDGLYFALPTRAAARQIHERVRTALENVFPNGSDLDAVLAIPGYLRVGSEEKVGKRVGRFEVKWEDEPDEDEKQARWAAESARHYLGACAAIGTIDQALLAALEVKWAHLRAASLSRSLLVVDEVHASDEYMNQLLCCLLQDHIHVGGHAMLMSATLGSHARQQLCNPQQVEDEVSIDAAVKVPYPSLTEVSESKSHIHPVNESHDIENKIVTMRLESWMDDPLKVAKYAIEQALEGAVVLVIRNTVKSAQAVFESARELGRGKNLLLTAQGVETLHHSRFAVEDRTLLDQAVENVMGKQGESRKGVIVIGTQTLEQSLDIDADLLVTDLCPVDVLLQRIGRLHRHDSINRPRAFCGALCVLLTPANNLEDGLEGGLMKFGLGCRGSDGGGVYPNLLHADLTASLARQHSRWTIPQMNRLLVEKGTHPRSIERRAYELGNKWQKHWQEQEGQMAAENVAAQMHKLNRRKLFTSIGFPKAEDRIRTRLGEDGPQIRLDTPIVGPFGPKVSTFNLPAYLFGSELPTKKEIECATAEQRDGYVALNVGGVKFKYDNIGLTKEG